MKINGIAIFAFVTVFSLALAGCGDGATEAPAGGGNAGVSTPAVSAPPVPVPEATYEIGCGSCTFGKDVGGCATAVKVGDEIFVVEGPGVPDAHTSGLCVPETKKAVVAGEVKGGKLIATKFVVVE